MLRYAGLCIVIALGLMSALSCSGGVNITEPGATPEQVSLIQEGATEASGNTKCLGLWQVIIDEEANTIEAV